MHSLECRPVLGRITLAQLSERRWTSSQQSSCSSKPGIFLKIPALRITRHNGFGSRLTPRAVSGKLKKWPFIGFPFILYVFKDRFYSTCSAVCLNLKFLFSLFSLRWLYWKFWLVFHVPCILNEHGLFIERGHFSEYRYILFERNLHCSYKFQQSNIS